MAPTTLSQPEHPQHTRRSSSHRPVHTSLPKHPHPPETTQKNCEISAHEPQNSAEKPSGDTLSASLKIPPATAFWIYDDRQVIVENWHAELWIDDEASVETYLRTWKTLRESAVYGADAHDVINAARSALNPR